MVYQYFLVCTSSCAGPEVQFSAASYTVSESQRSLNVCMVLDLDLVTPLVVDVSVQEDAPVTAAGGECSVECNSCRW